MKDAKNKHIVKRRLIISVLFLMMFFLLQGVFVACGGLPASSTYEEDVKPKTEWEDPPEISTVQRPAYDIPEGVVQTDADDPDDYSPPSTRYAASSESDRYHRTSCFYVDNILRENLIYFYSEDSARRAGYYPCSVCSP